MSNALAPTYAANLASNVYLVNQVTSRAAFLAKYKTEMEFGESNFASGVTGGYVVNKPQVIAMLSHGKGKYKGHAFVAVKGTASLYDALTDLNTGVRTGHTGFPVHQGFYYAFSSILPELRGFVAGLKGVNVVHCVGHSLGGAIATLAADWMKAAGVASSVKLYTFGSPRVGMQPFAAKCTTRLCAGNAYRVYHKTDPVPMVPTWPFTHVPNPGVDYLIDSPMAAKPWEYHFMKHYIKSAENAGAWSAIAHNRPASYLDVTVEKWLKSDGMVSFTANSLELINAALIYVVKKIVHVSGIAVIGAIAGGLTLLDRMAIFIAKSAKLTTDLGIWIFHLVKKMAALIGVKVKEGAGLTVQFVRMVFLRVHRRIADMVLMIGKELA